MAVVREFTDPDKDAGVGYVLQHDDDLNEDVIVYVRSIPQRIEAEIRKGGSRKTTVSLTRTGKTEMEMGREELEVTRRTLRQRAAAALADTKFFEVFIGDEITAETYRALVPERVSDIKVGAGFRLDGSWNSKLRDHVLLEHSDLAQWIISKVDGSRFEERREEEKLRGN